MKQYHACILITALVSMPLIVHAQNLGPQVLSSCGTSFSTNSISISWTLGETATAVRNIPPLEISEGFHQPYTDSTVSNLIQPALHIDAHPNPLSRTVTVTFTGAKPRVTVRLYNLLGILVAERLVQSDEQTIRIPVAGCPDGMYFLVVLSPEMERLAVKKIIKAY